MAEPPPTYLHGTSADEQQHLSLLNDLLNEGSLRELRIRPGERVLDIGSGLAQLTRAMARAAGPCGRVLGVEQSPEQLAEAARRTREAGEEGLIELREGDAADLPLRPDEWGAFDLARARFLLEHVPDPLAVVRGMVRAVRSGGRVVLEDDDHDLLRLWPEPPGLGPLWRAYIRAYDRIGRDPLVGRRLVSLLHEAGATPTRNTWVFFGGCAGTPTFPGYVANLLGIISGARERIVAPGLLDGVSFDDTIAALHPWGDRADAGLWYGVNWADGVRRP